MSTTRRGLVALLILALLITGGIALLRYGLYGWTVFILFPVLLGGLASWFFRATTGARAAGIGALAAAAAACSLLVVGLEGLICVAMALPLAMPLGALGGWLAYRAESSRLITHGSVAMLLLLPSGIAWDIGARPPVFQVHTAITIAATPEQVW